MEWKMNHPIVYPTVDCAIFQDKSLDVIYLARKPNQTKWRFVGGFVDPQDYSYADAAHREAFEETGVICTILDYVTSQKVDDPRYRGKDDKIITTLFAMIPNSPDMVPTPKDDISDIKAFKFTDVKYDMLVDEHQSLFSILRAWRTIKLREM